MNSREVGAEERGLGGSLVVQHVCMLLIHDKTALNNISTAGYCWLHFFGANDPVSQLRFEYRSVHSADK